MASVVQRVNITVGANVAYFMFGSVTFPWTKQVVLKRMQVKLFSESTAHNASIVFLKLGDSTDWAVFSRPRDFTQFGATSLGPQRQIVAFLNGDWVGRLVLNPVPISWAVIANKGTIAAATNLEIHMYWEFEAKDSPQDVFEIKP
jgi:hypothetical protein